MSDLIIPAAVYLAGFAVYTWPWMAHPGRQFFTDTGDGYQNVWNVWWVNLSLTTRHQSPWQTTLLHFPGGTTLLGQTMNPFNGLVGIVLLRVMPLVDAFNVMVTFSFVATGVTTFWLCRFFCRRAFPSLVGGFLATFSAYHLAKTLGLMQLVSLEWVPLFILVWWRLLSRPRAALAVAAAVTLLLVLLCDYYYFLFSVIAAAAIAVHLRRRRELALDRRNGFLFGFLAALLTLPLPLALAWSNVRDPMQGGHASQSSDVLALLIDGRHWRFHGLTDWYYGPPGASVAESTVYLTLTGVALLAVALVTRRRLAGHTTFWLWFAAVPAVFSLGPHLVVDRTDTRIPLPFDLARLAIPVLDYNVEPERIIVMTTIATAVLAATVLSRLDLHRRSHRALAVIVSVGLMLEVWPSPPPSAPTGRPPYVAVLKRLPDGAVIDDAAVSDGRVNASLQLYDQVLDGKPMAFGYISRTPDSVARADTAVQDAITGQQFPLLCHRDGFRYLTTPADRPLRGLRLVYDDGADIIYALC
jgi:hypothetical protein